jgi:GNAT superfamily N-acetyltransferase
VISALFVEPSFRGLGIGKELVNQCINGLKNRGIKWVIVPGVLISSFVVEMLLSCGFSQLGTGFVLSL